MSDTSESDKMLIERIRGGDSDAWSDLIACYEGRLLAFCQVRLGRRAAAEDVVQETLIGFLTSLPNFDSSRPLESYLFSICAHKLTDYLRREGRRPMLAFASGPESSGESRVPSPQRGPSTLMRSVERKQLEDVAIAQALDYQISRWKQRGDWKKLQCIELLFVRGWANKDVASSLSITEQQVANYKFDFLAQLRKEVRKQSLSADVFPELYDDDNR
ncbi:MAG: sigma-70 family RNA polymerase sigma factor [Planctomycetales bacterium]|nr:sigma-70 family RNA polymerase sigma factor [Planctomycetales bacterium]